MWDELHTHLNQLNDYLNPSAASAAIISPDKDLPILIHKHLQLVLSRLHKIVEISAHELAGLLAASPPLRGQFWTFTRP